MGRRKQERKPLPPIWRVPDELWVDRFGLEPATQAALEAKGHTVKRVEAWGEERGPQPH